MKLNTQIQLVQKRMREQGIAYTLEKMWLNGIRRPVLQRWNYQRFGPRYPQSLIFLAGQAKSGSTWFAKMFASLPGFELRAPVRWKIGDTSQSWKHFDVTNLDDELWNEFVRQLVVIKAHTWGLKDNTEVLRRKGIRYLISVRDPRDLLISHYYYAKNFPENWDHPNARDRTLPEYIDFKLEDERWNRESVDWCREWLNNRDPEMSHLMKYEEALEDAEAVVRKALEFLRFPCSDALVTDIVSRNSFERMSGRKRGEENAGSFHRKGISGEWREVFSVQQKREFSRQAGDVLEILGYDIGP